LAAVIASGGLALKDIDPIRHNKKGRRNRPWFLWLPLVNALRKQFARPTKELIDTILVGQAQVKDGFLAAIHE
jgi:hypothetical protein